MAHMKQLTVAAWLAMAMLTAAILIYTAANLTTIALTFVAWLGGFLTHPLVNWVTHREDGPKV